ncbi:MAG: ribonuclease HII [Promethearchaeota archaeon]
MSSLCIAGVDEAGRGPVIGPLVIAGIVVKEEHSEALVEWGVRDSKDLTRRKREALELSIRRIALQVEVMEISAAEIDTRRSAKRSLNDLEAEWMAIILQHLQWDVAYVDAADVVAERYGRTIQARLETEKTIVSEHKADQNYPVVAAASILAKVRRDRRISELHNRYGDFGSGYPSDPLTRRFLREWIAKYGTFPEIVRHSWETARKILATRRQQTLP